MGQAARRREDSSWLALARVAVREGVPGNEKKPSMAAWYYVENSKIHPW
jgi:hypothetical protein